MHAGYTHASYPAAYLRVGLGGPVPDQLAELIKIFILSISPFENNAHFIMIVIRQEKHSCWL